MNYEYPGDSHPALGNMSPKGDGDDASQSVDDAGEGEGVGDKKEIQQKLQSISNKSQGSIFVAIVILFLFMSGYFVGIYIYNKMSIELFRESYSDLHTIHQRSICLSKLFYYSREDIQTGTIAELGGGDIQGYKSLSMD